jgi:hypothetical protein
MLAPRNSVTLRLADSARNVTRAVFKVSGAAQPQRRSSHGGHASSLDGDKRLFREPQNYVTQTSAEYAGKPASASWTEAIENQQTQMLS